MPIHNHRPEQEKKLQSYLQIFLLLIRNNCAKFATRGYDQLVKQQNRRNRPAESTQQPMAYQYYLGRHYSSGISDDSIFFIRRGRFQTNKIIFICRGRFPTNKIMFFGILFNSCFSLFNSLEILFNKESFLKT